MSVLASHYHSEKEKNIKMISEMQRQNQTLQRLENHIKMLQNENEKAEDLVDKLKDELAKEKTVVDKPGYN